MAYTYEAPFVDPHKKDIKELGELAVKKPKRKKKKSRRESLKLENLVSDDFRLRRHFDKQFPVGPDGEYVQYDIAKIVDSVSQEARDLKKLVRQKNGQVTLDLFEPSREPPDPLLLSELEERGSYAVARDRALKKLGFYGEPWKWGTVYSVISEETWRRRKMRAAWKEKKLLSDAREAELIHNLPFDD